MVKAITLLLEFAAINILKIYVCIWSDQKKKFVLSYN